MLRPIATPLVMSGFEPDVAGTLGAAFQDQGFVPMAGAAGTHPGEMPFDGPLKPGDAIGVTFVNGDLELGATGTVTHIDGDRVYAFGHPMYNLGPTAFPMTRAYVYTVAAEFVFFGEALGDERSDRDVYAGPRNRDRRPHRPRAEPPPRHDDAGIGPRR